VKRVWADSTYRGKKMAAAAPAVVEIVSGHVGQKGPGLLFDLV
jgi:hypothetical protein